MIKHTRIQAVLGRVKKIQAGVPRVSKIGISICFAIVVVALATQPGVAQATTQHDHLGGVEIATYSGTGQMESTLAFQTPRSVDGANSKLVLSAMTTADDSIISDNDDSNGTADPSDSNLGQVEQVLSDVRVNLDRNTVQNTVEDNLPIIAIGIAALGMLSMIIGGLGMIAMTRSLLE